MALGHGMYGGGLLCLFRYARGAMRLSTLRQQVIYVLRMFYRAWGDRPDPTG